MEKKTVIINVETADGVKELDRLSAKFDEVYGDVLPLTAAIGELEDQLYQMAIAGEKDTQAFKDLSERAGQLKKTIMQVDMEVDALSMTAGNKLGGALGGVTAGFELVQGAMGAMGAESEKVQEALLKVQSAMAIAQGVQGIKEAVPAFRAFNSVLLANPILTIVAGFAALVTVLTKLASDVTVNVAKAYRSVTAAAESFRNKLSQINELQNKTTNQVLKALDQEAARRIAMGEDALRVQKEINDSKIKELEIALQQDEAGVRALRNQKNKLLEVREETKEKIKQAILDEQKNERDAIWTVDVERARNRIKALKEQELEIDKETQKAINVTTEELVKRKDEVEAERDAIEALKTANIGIATQEKERTQAAKERAAQAEETTATIIDYEQMAADQTEELRQQELVKQKAADDKRLEQEAEAARISGEIYASNLAYQQKLDDDAAKLKDERRKAEYQLAQESLSVLSDLVGAFAGKNEKSQKRAFNIQKSISIAQAVMDTYKGANAIFASAAANPASVLFPAQPFIQAGLAVAAGLANVKKIASTQFGGGSASGGGGGGSSSSGSSPNVSASMPANFNVVGNSGVNQLAQSLTNQPIQAYVVAGDVTTAQSMDRNKVKTASL